MIYSESIILTIFSSISETKTNFIFISVLNIKSTSQDNNSMHLKPKMANPPRAISYKMTFMPMTIIENMIYSIKAITCVK